MFTTGVEWTTAVTDLINGVVALVPLVWCLRKRPLTKRYKLWAVAFGMLSMMSIAGFLIHGIVMSESMNDALWYVMYLFIALLICAYVIAVRYDLDADEGFPRFIKGSIFVALIVIVISELMLYFLPDYSYPVLSLYAVIALIYCLVRLFRQVNKRPGFRWYITAIFALIVGSVLQAVKSIQFTIIWTFNYNAVYHWMILMFMLIQFQGIRKLGKLDRKNYEELT